MRFTTLPLTEIYIENTHRNPALSHNTCDFSCTLPGNSPYRLKFQVIAHRWKPILRGVLCEERDSETSFSIELQSNGLVEIILSVNEPENRERGYALYSSWFMNLLSNTLAYTHRIRTAAGVNDLETLLEVQIYCIGDLSVDGYSTFGYHSGTIKQGNIVFPRYSVGSTEEFSHLCSVIETDFWHHAGTPSSIEEAIRIDFSVS